MSKSYILLINQPYLELFIKDPAPKKDKVLKIQYLTTENELRMVKFKDNSSINLKNIAEIKKAYYYAPKHILDVSEIITQQLKLSEEKDVFATTNFSEKRVNEFDIPDKTKLWKNIEYNNIENIEYSVVIPVYNQEKIIEKNINSIITNMSGTFELFIILDFCFDKTKSILENFLDKKHSTMPNSLSRIVIFENTDVPLFETKCDNMGFKNSLGKYCLEIQADMEMCEFAFNKQLTRPFDHVENVIAVSGRCTHNIFGGFKGIGKTGRNIGKSIKQLGVNKNKFYSMETCNRGPLLLDRLKLKEMDYLDEKHYFLGNDDHDLMVRSYVKHKYICGYTPIDFIAPLGNGSCRSRDRVKNEKMKKINAKALKKNKKLFKGNHFNTYKKNWEPRKMEIFNLPKNNAETMKSCTINNDEIVKPNDIDYKNINNDEMIITDDINKNIIDLNKNKVNKLIFKQEKTIRNAFLLTGDTVSKRYKFVSKLLTKIGFTVIPVIFIRLKKKVKSNKNSMMKIYKLISTSVPDNTWSYVFEDDINILDKNLKLNDIIKYEPISTNLFYLGMCDPDKRTWIKTKNKVDGKIVRQKRGMIRGLHAIALSKEGALSLYDFTKDRGHGYMDVFLDNYTKTHPANVMRSDLISPCHPGHKGMFYQDRNAFTSLISV